jgi:hypothetical protein
MYNISLIGIVTTNPPYNEYIPIKFFFKKEIIKVVNFIAYILAELKQNNQLRGRQRSGSRPGETLSEK